MSSPLLLFRLGRWSWGYPFPGLFAFVLQLLMVDPLALFPWVAFCQAAADVVGFHRLNSFSFRSPNSLYRHRLKIVFKPVVSRAAEDTAIAVSVLVTPLQSLFCKGKPSHKYSPFPYRINSHVSYLQQAIFARWPLYHCKCRQNQPVNTSVPLCITLSGTKR